MTNIDLIYPPNQISLREVGLRDGLQMVKSYPSTAAKLDWIEQEYKAGIRHFEVGTFLPKDRYPMFADIDILIEKFNRLSDAHCVGLSPNKRGGMNGLASGVDEIYCVISATELHNQANLNRSQATSLSEIADLCRLRDDEYQSTIISVGIAMSFGCSLAGAVAPKDVLSIAEACYDMGADIVSLADTVGYAGPKQVASFAKQLHKLANGKPFGIHLHDTRGLGIANATAALDQGVRILDASLGGLGGCPAAPMATGNIVMEDLVFLCQTHGFDTGIDIQKLVKIRDILSREMPTETLYGALAKAGLPKMGVAHRT